MLLTVASGIVTNTVVHSLSPSVWPWISVPPADDPVIMQLMGLNKLWEYQLTLSTFILTFFTSQVAVFTPPLSSGPTEPAPIR